MNPTKEVSGANGYGKVKIIYKKKPTRKTKYCAYLVYFVFGSFMYISFAWSHKTLRHTQLIPFFRSALSLIDFCKFYFFNRNQLNSDVLSAIQFGKNQTIVESSTSVEEATYFQGLSHAIDRFYQMDIYRRAAIGNLSALLGEKSLYFDQFSRTMKFYELAKRDLMALDNETMILLQSYADGVNHLILSNEYSYSYPVEFTWSNDGLFSKKSFVPWEPLHSLAIYRMLLYEWHHGWEDQLLDKLYQKLPISFDSDLLLTNRFKVENIKRKNFVFLSSVGGTSIAVSKMFSKTNGSIMLGDFHGTSHHQGYWYMNKLLAPNFSVEGFSFPGVPLVFIGRNQYVSWSLTSSASRDDGDIDKVTLRNDNEKVNIITIEESIKVAGWKENFIHLVKDSEHGVDLMDILAPTMKSPLLQNNIGSVFLSSTLNDHRSNFSAFRLLNTALNIEEANQSMNLLSAYSLNFVCAFSDGKIGYFDRTANGSFLRSFEGVIVASDSLNPVQLMTDTCWENETNFANFENYKEAGFSVQTLVTKILKNTFSPSSLTFKDYLMDLLRRLIDNEEASELGIYFNSFYHHLDSFDGYYEPESVAPSIIEGFKTIFLQRILTKATGTLMNHYVGQNISAVQRNSMNHFRKHVGPVFLEKNGEQVWLSLFDADKNSMLSILREMIEWYQFGFGDNPDFWQWGTIRPLYVKHASYKTTPILDAVNAFGPVHSGGGGDSAFRVDYVGLKGEIGWETDGSFASVLRFAVDLNNSGFLDANILIDDSHHPYYWVTNK